MLTAKELDILVAAAKRANEAYHALVRTQVKGSALWEALDKVVQQMDDTNPLKAECLKALREWQKG